MTCARLQVELEHAKAERDRLQAEAEAWEKHGQEETFARERAEEQVKQLSEYIHNMAGDVNVIVPVATLETITKRAERAEAKLNDLLNRNRPETSVQEPVLMTCPDCGYPLNQPTPAECDKLHPV